MTKSSDEATSSNVNITPLFDGERFKYWKDRLKSFNISRNRKVSDMVKDDYKCGTQE